VTELATVGVLAAAPAVIILNHGSWDVVAVAVWGVCALFFGSSVFYVKMLVGASRPEAGHSRTASWQSRAERLSMLYHLTVLAVVVVAALFVSERTATLLAVAYVPIVARASYSLIFRPVTRLNLKRIGVAEIGYSVWFGVFVSAALRGPG